MYKNYCGQINIIAENYLSQEEYRKAVSDMIFLLMSNGYQLKVYTEINEDMQTIIEYGYIAPEYEDYLIWCDEDDREAIVNDRYVREHEWEK